MAEGFLRQLLQERGASTVTLSSAGVYSWDDSPATPEAVRALTDEDVADPLGLGIEAFRAAAWELGELCQRLANAVFGPAGADAGDRAAEAGREGARSLSDRARPAGAPGSDTRTGAARGRE